MVWSWSHSAEAYDTARENVHGKDRDWLEVVFAEWKGAKFPKDAISEPDLNERKYNAALRQAKRGNGVLCNDILADFICEQMSAQALCENGGHEAWACPFGCHTISFDREPTSAFYNPPEDPATKYAVRTNAGQVLTYTYADILNPDDFDGRPFYVIGFNLSTAALAVIHAATQQAALDELADSGKLDSSLIESPESTDSKSATHLGNEGKAYDLTDIWIYRFKAKAYMRPLE